MNGFIFCKEITHFSFKNTYISVWETKGNVGLELKFSIFTSWLDTSEWSLRVIPSPMADFINRDKDGSTLIGG